MRLPKCFRRTQVRVVKSPPSPLFIPTRIISTSVWCEPDGLYYSNYNGHVLNGIISSARLRYFAKLLNVHDSAYSHLRCLCKSCAYENNQVTRLFQLVIRGLWCKGPRWNVKSDLLAASVNYLPKNLECKDGA